MVFALSLHGAMKLDEVPAIESEDASTLRGCETELSFVSGPGALGIDSRENVEPPASKTYGHAEMYVFIQVQAGALQGYTVTSVAPATGLSAASSRASMSALWSK